jgi:CelD/BcsL family acetyltransferase involved in cellulose biosynthesis
MQQDLENILFPVMEVSDDRSSRPISVVMLTDPNDFDALREEWDQLLADSDQHVYFLRWSWIRLWWSTYAPPGARLNLMLCYDEHQRLIGLAPLYSRIRKIAGVPMLNELFFLGTGIEIITSEYLDIIARSGYESDVAKAIAQQLKQNREWDRLLLWGIPQDSKIYQHFQKEFGGKGRATVCDQMQSLDVEQSWETLKQEMGSNLRTNIDRYSRRMAKLYDCRFRSVETSEELETGLNEFIRLHTARWRSKGESGSFALRGFEKFLREAARRSLAEGRLKLWTLTLDGKCAAALLAFVDFGVAHYFQGGFDPEYGKHHLGTVMLSYCIQDCIGSKQISKFDFMGGGSAYKQSWTKSSREAIELEAFRHTLPAMLYRIARASKSSAAEVSRPFRRRIKTLNDAVKKALLAEILLVASVYMSF